MGAMDLHSVETRLFRPYRRPGEGVDRRRFVPYSSLRRAD